MVTVDSRRDPEFPESSLKFWRYDDNHLTYKLDSVVEYPHKYGVTSLAISKDLNGVPVCVTTSKDGGFKIWAFGKNWQCRFYKKFKNTRSNLSVFSKDGSVLAMCYGNLITIWDPITSDLVKVLRNCKSGGGGGRAFKIEFMNELLVVIDKSRLVFWDLLTAEIKWSLKMNVIQFAIDCNSEKFAVVTRKDPGCFLYVFNGGIVPIFATEVKMDPMSIVFLPDNEKDKSKLVMMNHNLTFFTWTYDSKNDIEDEFVATVEDSSLFKTLYANFGEETKDDSLKIGRSLKKVLGGLVDVPSHVSRPPSKLLSSFMKGLLMLRSEAAVDDSAVEVEDCEEFKMDIDCSRDEDTLTTIGSLNNWLENLVINDDKITHIEKDTIQESNVLEKDSKTNKINGNISLHDKKKPVSDVQQSLPKQMKLKKKRSNRT
jgi:NET1-associated nuclear protein 1 (U3 small nucleolar RNA-associated protein 17)